METLEARRISQQKRITRVLLWVLVLFVVCYIPGAAVIYTLQLCTKSSTLKSNAICSCKYYHIMRDVSFYFLTVNSCMNPFVYAFRNKHYRHALMALCTRSRETCAETGVRTTQYGSKRFYNKGTNFYYEVIEMSLIKLLHFIFFLLDKLMKWLKGLKDLPAKKIEPKNSTFTTNTIFIRNF